MSNPVSDTLSNHPTAADLEAAKKLNKVVYQKLTELNVLLKAGDSMGVAFDVKETCFQGNLHGYIQLRIKSKLNL